MSRRRGEFEHRTSIFEGAYRAWSHLGGIDPTHLSATFGTAADLDPLSAPHADDPRVPQSERNKVSNVIIDSSGKTRLFPYEPLPRSGLAHPFVQAIISPWLGPDAEHDDIILGLTTLRTWWQHRRKGESSSAKSALGTDKMMSVVEGYTRHFFNLAHCIVMSDGEQPPRSLGLRIRDLQRNGVIFTTFKRNDIAAVIKSMPSKDAQILESSADAMDEGGGGGGTKGTSGDQSCCGTLDESNAKTLPTYIDETKYWGDRDKTPVVFVSDRGDIQIAMGIAGITCGNCVKIIETVLKGVNGAPSPIKGIIDAAADRDLSMVIIKISKSSFAKRIAHEAAENLKMVGYDAKTKEMGIIDPASGAAMDLSALRTAFDIVAATDAKDVFDWNMKCVCPDNGILRTDCTRHNQMNKGIFEAFDLRQEQIKEFMGGCGKKYGLQCTCGDKCKCSSGKCCGPGATEKPMTASVQTITIGSMQSSEVPKAPVTHSMSNATLPPQSQQGQAHAMANIMYRQQQSQAMAQHRQQPQGMVQHHQQQSQTQSNMGQPNMGQPNMGQPNSRQPNMGQPNVAQRTALQPNMPQQMTHAAMGMPRYPTGSISGPVVGNYVNGQFVPNMMYVNQQPHSTNAQKAPSTSFWNPR